MTIRQVATRTYNNSDQLTALTYKKGTSTLGTLTYAGSNAGLVATTTPSGGGPGTTDTYTYNPRAQLTSRNNTRTTLAYDGADRATKTLNGTTAAASTYTYDGDGLRANKTPAAEPPPP